jgi:hypothetical protein
MKGFTTLFKSCFNKIETETRKEIKTLVVKNFQDFRKFYKGGFKKPDKIELKVIFRKGRKPVMFTFPLNCENHYFYLT